MKTEPNQAMQTIPRTVTPRAYARVAPLRSMSDLGRSANNMEDYTVSIMSQFRAAGCAIKELGENFEIVPESFPAKTHVYANSHFIQFSTFLYIRPKKMLGRFRWARDAFINEANAKTHLAKLSCNESKFDSVWSLLCQWRIVSGVTEHRYSDEAIEHLITLWLQDLAFVIQNDESYEVIAMLEKK